MTTAVLFLDASYRPLRVASWERAITDLFLGKCEIVEYSKDRMIQGVSERFPMPAVVRVLRNFKRDRIAVKFSRLNIYTRDNFACQYCGDKQPTEDLTFDHVLPRSKGGKTSWENIVTCCAECNRKKDARTPEQAGMRLKRKPVKPKYLPVVTVKLNRREVPAEWLPYWSVTLDS